MADAATDKPDRARLLAHFAGDTAEHKERWSTLWDKGDFLPWDRGTPNPALEDLLADRQNLIGDCFVEDAEHGRRRKRALVPGCGRGYDVLLLASFGYDAYGLEISHSAVQMCRREQQTNAHKYPLRDTDAGAGEVSFLAGDFFGDDWASDVGGGAMFDLIYDYTFLSALPPSLRPSWALGMSRRLDPAGKLVCVEFPTYKDPSTGGPPYALPPDVYLAHLSQPGKGVRYGHDGRVKRSDLDEHGAAGLVRLAHWQPERTHEIGKGTDWVSVWQHK